MKREQVRMTAAEMFAQDMTPPQVAQQLRVSQKSAYVWHQRWQAGGKEALASKGPSGRRSRLTPVMREQLAVELDRGPAEHGWTEDQRWTLARVVAVIARRFGLSFSIAQTWQVLRQMGWSAQVPAHRAVERDEAAIATWVKEVWPQVKKPRRTPARGSFSKTSPDNPSDRPRRVPGRSKARLLSSR
jgi:putative transposase